MTADSLNHSAEGSLMPPKFSGSIPKVGTRRDSWRLAPQRVLLWLPVYDLPVPSHVAVPKRRSHSNLSEPEVTSMYQTWSMSLSRNQSRVQSRRDLPYGYVHSQAGSSSLSCLMQHFGVQHQLVQTADEHHPALDIDLDYERKWIIRSGEHPHDCASLTAFRRFARDDVNGSYGSNYANDVRDGDN